MQPKRYYIGQAKRPSTKMISELKFTHDDQYRQGVNDAIDELLLFQKELIDDSYNKGLWHLYDKVTDLINCKAENYPIDLNWENEWKLIRKAVFHVYNYALKELEQLKKYQ